MKITTNKQVDWIDIRWNEANELFNELLWQVKDLYEQDCLISTVPVVSNRLANASLDN